MNILLNRIAYYAKTSPKMCALKGVKSALTYAQLHDLIAQYTSQFKLFANPVIALCVENHPAWVVLDLAAMQAEVTLVPIPFFFSKSQQIHALQDAGAHHLITDRPAFYRELLAGYISSEATFAIEDKMLTHFCLNFAQSAVSLPSQTAKITYTSGTTGNPKGVCLSAASQLTVAQSLQSAVHLQADEVHLSMLPLSTLLENIAGVYTPLLSGATAVLLPACEVGVDLENANSGGLNVQKMLNTLIMSHANTAILTPELLLALTTKLEVLAQAGESIGTHLRFLAVGGASVSPSLLERARAVGLPVFEGYGLSECCSVVALNTEGHTKIGSVGKVLPHVSLRFAKDGEMLVQGATMLGYTNQPKPHHATSADHVHATGDIGRLDADGYLYIIGRKKNMFITSFGRNVSPEWVEREIKVSPYIVQAILFGEAKPWNTLIVTPSKHATHVNIQSAIDAVNANLPDYARVREWLVSDTPFSKDNHQLTDNGRLRREAIWQHYQTKINALYQADLAPEAH